MTPDATYCADWVFDGTRLHQDAAIRFGALGVEALLPRAEAGPDAMDLGDAILSPGFTDLQVNGGGGVMLNDGPSADLIGKIAAAHWGLGVRRLLPTLITDAREVASAAIAAVEEAIAAGAPGVAGLHLEGPHLSIARKGAHDAAHIRPMTEPDLAALLDAKARLPVLMVTIAPESVSPEQVRAMAAAGIIVSLGHTDADFETCLAYAKAGARAATHLFNAMSQMGSRAPGLVGAAIASGALSAGLIADGVHVHPDMMRIAWRGKRGPGEMFLVSDAMAVAGTDARSFDLGGREVLRAEGRLVLADGTLAGADLDLVTALRVLVEQAEVDLADALRAATSAPEALIFGAPRPFAGRPSAEFIQIDKGLTAARPLPPTA